MTHPKIELEDAVEEAVLMSKLTLEFLGRGLGFDQGVTDPLSNADMELLHFAVSQTAIFTVRARDAFTAVTEAGLL